MCGLLSMQIVIISVTYTTEKSARTGRAEMDIVCINQNSKDYCIYKQIYIKVEFPIVVRFRRCSGVAKKNIV